MKRCFINDSRCCTHNCAAFDDADGKSTHCRLINTFEKLVPLPTRPQPPAPPIPKVTR